MEKYSDEQLKNFYTTFASNLKHYESVNSDTMDTLFAFQDFDAFKKKMLMYKRGMDDGTLKRGAVEETETLPLKDLVAAGTDIEGIKKIFFDLEKEDVNDKSFGWKTTLKMPEKDGMSCNVYTRPIPGRRVNMCKNVTTYKGITLEAWFEYSVNFMTYLMDDPEFQKNANKGKRPDIKVIEENADKTHTIVFSRSGF